MAANIQFIRIGENNPIILNRLDEEICRAVGDEIHPLNWCRNWYNVIALDLAMGNSFKEVKNKVEEWGYFELSPVIDYIEKNFRVNCWRD